MSNRFIYIANTFILAGGIISLARAEHENSWLDALLGIAFILVYNLPP